MGSINTDYSQYMHTYEAFRIPKGHEALDAPNADLIKTEDGSELILTDEARKQLIKDRFAYGNMLNARAEQAAQKTQEEGMRQFAENQRKALAVFHSMSKGDIVPSSDEQKLIEFDQKLYQAAKMAQMLAQKEKRKEKKSEWDEREEAENRERLNQLAEESNELAGSIGSDFSKFASAQKDAVVEIDVSNVDLSSIQSFVKYSGDIGGAIFDKLV